MSASSTPDYRGLLSNAYVELKALRAELDAAESQRRMPIAVIGMGCRFPGGADAPSAFWRLLSEGRDAVTRVPPDRWDADAFFDPNPDAPGKMYTRSGGFLDRVDLFDPQFFGISPREAESLDPQQRLLLEVAWEALEHAGRPPESLYGSRTGVFVGISNFEYAKFLMADVRRIDAYAGSGSALNVAAGRLSYCLGLTGPCLAVDTACSSSLVATHLACQSLREGESDLALAAGVNLILSPEVSISFSKAHFLAPDGRCKTFDAAADGYARGEGCGVLVLKRLSDAMCDGDTVWALIRGSAVNQDGPSGGLTVPSGPSQQAVMRQALESAGQTPSDVSYVEAHGTGTALGDPIELGAVDAVYGQDRSAHEPLLIASVKTNIGHLEAAAGMAGLIKTVLCLHHAEIPPHLHLQSPNPHVPWQDYRMKVPTRRQPWPAVSGPRRAGVSGFGFSGTNAHIVLEEAPAASLPRDGASRAVDLLVLSAKSEPALVELAERYADHLRGVPDELWADACYTTRVGRSHHPRRLSVVAASPEDASRKLTSFASGEAPAGLSAGHAAPGNAPKVAFLFTGQGAQWAGMARELYEAEPVFRQTFDACAASLAAHLDPPLADVLYPKPGAPALLDETTYTQPALFALEYALAQVWRQWGIRPDVVIGHSVGEYVAAALAGVFSVDAGLALIAARGRLMQTLSPEGAMLSVFAPAERVAAALAPAREVSVAALNGPRHTVISGNKEAIAQLAARFRAEGIETHPLAVSRAFHSPLMGPMLPEFARLVREVSLAPPQIGLISNLSGDLASDDIATPEYWVRHVREPVSFAPGMDTLARLGVDVFLEIGPKPVLLGMGRQCLPESTADWLPSLRPGQPDWQVMHSSLGRLYTRGAKIDWAGFHASGPGRKVELPTYPFQRQRYWVQSAPEPAPSAAGLEAAAQGLAASGQLSPDEARLLPKLLASLNQTVARAAAPAESPPWYEIVWEARSLAPAPAPRAGGRWLILTDSGGLGEALAHRLAEQGHACTLAVAADSGEGAGDRGELDPANPEDFVAWLESVAGAEAPVQAVVFLWGLDASDHSPEAAARSNCLGLTHLVQALLRAGHVSPKLWLVTRNAMSLPVDPTPVAVAQAPLWGLGRVLALEHPDLWGGLIDLSATATAGEAERVFGEMTAGGDEDQVAFRGGQRFVARLVPGSPPPGQSLPIDPSASYLITGGLGALGLRVADWLVKQGARSLMLLGRKGAATDEARAAVAALEGAGARVLALAADVADVDAMAEAFARLEAEMPPLRGVVHAAGASSYRLIEDLNAADLDGVLNAKVRGAWNLHTLTRAQPLGFFVCFSSIASVWGSKAQGHYAAANSFLDALAHHRRALGLAGTSINWGPWSGGGMLSAEFEAQLARVGVKALSPETALAALERVLGSGAAQVAVAAVDWETFKAVYTARRPRPLVERIDVPASSGRPPAEPTIRPQLLAAPPAEREALLQSYLLAEVGRVLGFGPDQSPDPQTGFRDLGMDSLMAVELKRRLEAGLGVPLSATLAFNYPNVRALSRHLAHDVFGWGDEPSAAPSAAADATRSQVEHLSDAEVEAAIDDELALLNQLLRPTDE